MPEENISVLERLNQIAADTQKTLNNLEAIRQTDQTLAPELQKIELDSQAVLEEIEQIKINYETF